MSFILHFIASKALWKDDGNFVNIFHYLLVKELVYQLQLILISVSKTTS